MNDVVVNCSECWYYDSKVRLCHLYDLPRRPPVEGYCRNGDTADRMRQFIEDSLKCYEEMS